MDLNNFSEQVEAMNNRLEKFFRETESDLSLQNLPAARAIEELHTMVEELQVASEELSQRNVELAELNLIINEERQRYNVLFELAPVGYIVTNQKGKILEANQAAAKLLNVPQTNLVGKPLIIYIDIEDRKLFRSELARMINLFNTGQKQIKNWEIRLQPRKRDILFVTLHVAVSSNNLIPSGYALLWSIHDISERKRAQIELQRAKDELEERVVYRTAELSKANERLRSYAHEIERKNREMEDFTFIASHDLQEPLRKIKMFSDLLKNKRHAQLDEEDTEYINRMTTAASRMQDMVNGLLGYSRVSTKISPIVPMELNRLASEVLLDLDYRIKSLDGHADVEELPVVEADPLQIRALFTNLIDNALKFRRMDIPPEIKIWAEKNPENVKIYFQDNGIGINLEHFQQIFHPFQREHARHEYDGTGMGLAICRKIVERHHGVITVESTPGKGSIFIVTLPTLQREYNQHSSFQTL